MVRENRDVPLHLTTLPTLRTDRPVNVEEMKRELRVTKGRKFRVGKRGDDPSGGLNEDRGEGDTGFPCTPDTRTVGRVYYHLTSV